MVPAPPAGPAEGYRNGLFDFGPDGGVAVNPETRLPAPGMTEFYRPGDGETAPGLFDIAGVRRNEDGGLPAKWYEVNEPQSNFGSRGKGKWKKGRVPKVEVMPGGHVGFIDDGVGF